MTGMTSIRFSNIYKLYRRNTILDHIDIELQQRQSTLLCGANGAGKTTLLKIMAGLEKPDHGSIDTGFGDIHWRRCRRILQERVMYLHQHPYMFDATVSKNIGYALPRGSRQDKRHKRIGEALDWAGLEDLASASAIRLSGGEAQRVALARAWLREPSVLLLDEPTANMDQESRLRTHALLGQLKENGMTIVITSHDILQFRTLVDRLLLLEHGRLAPIAPDRPDNVSTFPIDQVLHQQA